MYDDRFDDVIDELIDEYEDSNLDAMEKWESDLDYSVIGPTDDRFSIPSRSQFPSTRYFPYSTICFLEDDTPSGRFPLGTGTLIAPRVVLTARHVLDGVSRIRVTPGADFCAATRRTVATPAFQEANAAQFRPHSSLDFGIIILPQAFRLPDYRSGPRPSPYPFMMLQPRGDPNIATLLTIAGYPCDKPLGTLWGHSNRIPIIGVSKTHLSYSIDTCPGHSGSPIWLLGNNGIRLLLGVHTSGPSIGPSGCVNDPRSGTCRHPRCGENLPVSPVAGPNRGVRVTCQVIRAIQTWCREAGVVGPIIDSGVFQRRCGAA